MGFWIAQATASEKFVAGPQVLSLFRFCCDCFDLRLFSRSIADPKDPTASRHTTIETPMNCTDIAAKIQRFNPNADPLDVARMCALICSAVTDYQKLENDEHFLEVWDEVNLRIQAATDQHAAVTEELESLSTSDPEDFAPEQVWVLVRSIKVQNQLLRLYVGDPSLEMG